MIPQNFNWRTNVAMEHNGWCYEQVCLAEMFKFSTNVIGKLAYSDPRLCVGGEIEAEMFKPPLNLNRITNDE